MKNPEKIIAENKQEDEDGVYTLYPENAIADVKHKKVQQPKTNPGKFKNEASLRLTENANQSGRFANQFP